MSDKKFEDIAGWYLVANVRENQPFGKNHEIRKGTKHFAPNTKVYCSYPQWGDGYENIIVGGRHRGSSKLVCMVIHWTKLTNWRTEYAYVPPLGSWEVDEWKSKEQVELWAKRLRWRQEVRDVRKKGFEKVNPDDALVYALAHGSIEAAREAIERGADVNYRLRYDRLTPLTAALTSLTYYRYRKEMVDFLLNHGAKIETINYDLIDSVSQNPTQYPDFVVDLVKKAINELFPLKNRVSGGWEGQKKMNDDFNEEDEETIRLFYGDKRK